MITRPTVCLAGFTFSRFESSDFGVWPKRLGSLLREEGAGGSLVAGVWAPGACRAPQEGTAEARKDFCGLFPGHRSCLNGVCVIGTRCRLCVKPF